MQIGFLLFHQSDNLLCGICQIPFCVLTFHGLLQSYHSTEDREKCIDSRIVAGSCVTLYGARKSDHFFAIFLCKFCNTYRSFSHGCLSIHASLTCDHKIRVFDVVLKFCLIQYDVDSGFQNCIGKCKKRKSHSTGCSSSKQDRVARTSSSTII
mgnify:CR=1 FL=1